jgi:predicted nicotinamide N-methyase
LRRRFDVVEQRLAIAGRTFDLLHPRSADDLINDDDFNRDERLPYWAEFWPSAYVLAQRVASEPAQMDGHRKRLLELGCGSGLVTVSALAAGFTVTAIDYYPEALDFVRLNAMRNRLPEPRSLVVDWRQYPDNLADFDVVVAADVLYERDYCQLIAAAFKQSLRPGELGILTDPQRTRAEPFPDACRRNGLKISPPQVFGPLSVPGGDAAVRQTVNLFEIRCGE